MRDRRHSQSCVDSAKKKRKKVLRIFLFGKFHRGHSLPSPVPTFSRHICLYEIYQGAFLIEWPLWKNEKFHTSPRTSPNELKPSKMNSTRKMGSKYIILRDQFWTFVFFSFFFVPGQALEFRVPSQISKQHRLLSIGNLWRISELQGGTLTEISDINFENEKSFRMF